MNWTRTAAAVVLIAATTAAAQPATTPALSGSWESVGAKDACAVRQGPVMIGTADGKHFSLFVSGVKVGDRPMRPVSLDGKTYLLAFSQANQMGMADLDAATLGALSTAAQLVIDWPEGKAELSTAGLMPALNAATACGAKLEAKRVADARHAERARRAREAAEFIGDMAGGPADEPRMSSPRASAGPTCFKRREWTSGFNKNCVYDCAGSEAVQTIGTAELCPLTIRSPR